MRTGGIIKNDFVRKYQYSRHTTSDWARVSRNINKKLKIYTTRATVMKRMLRKGYKPSKVDTMQDEICSMTFEFDSKDIGNFLRTSIFKYD